MTTIRETDPGAFSHPALFYRDETSLLAGTVPFVRDGLAAGESVAVAVPEANLGVIERALGSAASQVLLVDMSEAGRNPGRIIPGVLRAFADGHDGPVRIIGEPVWPGRTDEEYAACVQHEALINAAFAGTSTTILCPYDAARLAATTLADAEATHPVVIGSDGARTSERFDPDAMLSRHNEPLEAPPDAVSMGFEVGDLAKARQVAADFAAEAGLATDRVQDLTLAVGELTGNSVQHGGGGGLLRVWADRTHVVCEVEDAGCFTDPLAGRRPVPLHQVGGRGLLLVNHVVDLVRTHRTADGHVFRVYLRLPEAAAHS
ncbi:sensor histidine kinase [Prauserella cavernicola]|uniref:sensor histidine kinase n=1 Tax=Prauserella cavernicola TaxID=2800127 RepID=UPI0027DD775A|nr:sensor histidine kinase [Prauserella cavernicola]